MKKVFLVLVAETITKERHFRKSIFSDTLCYEKNKLLLRKLVEICFSANDDLKKK